jgi:hypothetical protein
MILNFNKYRKRYAIAILAAYLLLVSISVLHYHHINIQTGDYEITTDKQNTCNDFFDKFVDITHECTIQHFTDTIINYNFITVFNVIKETNEQNISIKEIIKLPQAPLYNNNCFRAPPLFI